MAVLGATPAVAVFAHEKGKPEAQPEPERSNQPEQPEAVTEEPLPPIPACAGEFQAARPRAALRSRELSTGAGAGGSCAILLVQSLISLIRFLHLSVLQATAIGSRFLGVQSGFGALGLLRVRDFWV
ncbi:unnamed protein product [Symbiodinium sp. CCMP2592]|nr:unnamed protein product [Symbiodinium sp. CCMP2592]